MSTYHAKVIGLGRTEVFEAQAENTMDAYGKIHAEAVYYFGTRVVMVGEVKSGPNPESQLNFLKRIIGLK